ncbi:MAG: hypothetical protein R3C19_26245 [Planctomycetaceae bacterium]
MNSRCWLSCFLGCLTAFSGVSIAVAQSDVNGIVRLENGLLLSGVCGSTSGIDPYPKSHNLELRRIDQFFRRYYVSTRVSEQPVPDPTAVAAINFQIPQRRTGRAAMPAGIGVSKVSRFDPNGQATVELRMADGTTETIRIGITAINAQYAKVIGLTHDWEFGIATSSIPEDVLYPGILSNAKDFTDGGTRLNMVAALVEAGQIYPAQRLLDSVNQEFPQLSAQSKDLTDRVTQHVSKQILDELKLRQQVGQPAFAARSARLYNDQDLIPEARVAVKQLIEEHQQDVGRLKALQTALNDAVAALRDSRQQVQAQEMLTAIERELDIPLLPRFTPFELLSGAEGISPESQLALAASGWLLGADNAVQTFPEAYGLFRIRTLVLDYCRTADDEDDRRNELIERMRAHEGFSVERVANLLQNLPAVESVQPRYADELSIGVFSMSETESSAGCLGLVPPEYSENRQYPMLIALPREGLKASDTLTWWKNQAERNGFVVVVPEIYPSTTPDYDATADQHRLLLGLIRRMKLRLRIDDERVFIAGHGIGGEAAADFATAHPDLFAGVATIAGLGRKHLQWTAYNSADLSWYVVVGDKQSFWYDRMGLLLRKLFLRSSGDRKMLDVLLVRYPGRGFESFYEESPRLFEWMRLHRRTTNPDQLRDITLLRTTDRSWYWLQLDSIPDDQVSLDAANTHEETPEHTASLNAWLTANNGVQIRTMPGPGSVKLSPDLPGIDINKQIVIVSGGRRTRVDYKPSLRDLLDEFRSTADRKRLCFMKIPVSP